MINPMAADGQVEGSIVYNLGGCLYEEQYIDENGIHLNPNFHDYKMPTVMEMPEMDINTLTDSYDPTAPFGAKETGEGAVQPTFPAIVNAIYIHRRGVTEVPITEKVLKALKEKRSSREIVGANL